MAATHHPGGRRWFLRSATGAAATVLAMGAQTLFGASGASAGSAVTDVGCCWLFGRPTPWCPLLCAEAGHHIRCWTCNSNRCKCCECIKGPIQPGTDCFGYYLRLCAYATGCCE